MTLPILTINQLFTAKAMINQTTLDDQWHSFALQDCGYSSLIIYPESSNNSNVNVKIKTENLTGFLLTLSSRKKIGENSFLESGIQIEKTGLSEFSFETTSIRLQIETQGEVETFHKIVSTGQYSINGGAFQSFELTRCYPRRITIFHNAHFFYYLTIELNITKMEKSFLSLEHTASDVVMNEEIIKIGSKSLEINAYDVALSISSQGKIEGFFKIQSSGSEPIPNMDFPDFIFLILPFSLVFGKRKIKQILEKN